MHRIGSVVRGVAITCALGWGAGASELHAQIRPNADWQTIHTEHFYVHFTPELEEVARRAAADAEAAYAQLSEHLHPPRASVDIVISDDVDFSNGYATPAPSNRIVVYANPPVFESALRFTDDPTQLVVTHELTHIFHLDRVGGIWKVLQALFGRSAYLFPNSYSPSWLTEGLAVYYESKLTGSGRIEGTYHRMIARSAALQGGIPRLDQISLANPHFPYGYSAYAYGSLFMDHLAKEHGDESIRAFVDASSRQLIPLWLNWPARRAFGRSFTAEYRAWSDSLVKSAPPSVPPMSGWRDVTVDGAYAAFPRWLNDSTLVYTGTPGRETNGAYQLTLIAQGSQPPPTALGVTRRRIGRRNSRSPNSLLPNGGLLYSQLEYTSPYNVRSDLYVDQDGRTTRLTYGARLAYPDARADGLIAAVHILPGGSQIVLVSSDGKHVTPITSGGPDQQWTEPRWSPDGQHIAAVRWLRGGTSEALVIDTTGRVEQTFIRERVVNASPSWSPDGRCVFFSSDRGGISNLYRAEFRPGGSTSSSAAPTANLERVSDAATGLFEPQPSPTGAALAATVFRANGYHVGVAPLSDRRVSSTDRATSDIRAPTPDTVPPAAKVSLPATKYSPWRTLLPHYWIPYYQSSALSANSARLGAYTSGSDVVGRHAYQALLYVPTDNSGITGTLFYRNATLGQPVVDVVAAQDWENYGEIRDQSKTLVGRLRRRIRFASLGLTFLRPRARTSSYLSLSGGLEARDYATDPPFLLARLTDTSFRRAYYYPRLVASLGWSNAQYPVLAISPEDGFSLASTTRVRWRRDDNRPATVSVVASGNAYKSIDLPGFAHHVIALRAVGGMQDNRGTGYYEVGGVSGGTLDLFPGYTLGEGRRTFGVRGFPAASMLGMVAVAGSAEYRVPFVLPGRGLGTLPVFLDKTSVTLFGDVGSAWCRGVYTTSPGPSASLCTPADYSVGRSTAGLPLIYLEPHAIASVGGELNIAAAFLSWDLPYRLRAGVATPVAGTQVAPVPNKVTSYVAVGLSF